MNRFKFFIFFTIFLLSFFLPVSPQIVGKTALSLDSFCQNWLDQQMPSTTIYSKVCIIQKNDSDLYLITLLPYGYILLQKSNEIFSVVAFSDKNQYDLSECNPVSKGLVRVNPEPTQSNTSVLAKTAASDSIPPLTNAMFGQSGDWNMLCPSGSDGRSLVGCCGTAMAILLHYWQYPLKGREITEYTDSTYGHLSANFKETSYRWDLMSPTIADKYNAQLLYHCALSVKTMFGTRISSITPMCQEVFALRSYFGYSDSMYAKKRLELDDEGWKNLIKQQLRNGKPVLYSGTSETDTGHIFIIDGYRNDLFHINWGWSGNSNGYYSLENISYKQDQVGVFDIQPAKISPAVNLKAALNVNNSEVNISWDLPENDNFIKYYELPYKNPKVDYMSPKRATFFCINDFSFDTPLTITAIAHTFSVSGVLNADSTFNFMIADADGKTVLYTSPDLKAVSDLELKHKLTHPLTVSNDFYVVIQTKSPIGLPLSRSTSVPVSSSHSFCMSDTSWTNVFPFVSGGIELHTTVFINGKYRAGQFPHGGYIVYRNNIPIDTIKSLETTSYADRDLSNGKRTYKTVTYFDTTFQRSIPGDSATIDITSNIVEKHYNKPGLNFNLTNTHAQVIINQRSLVQISIFDLSGRKITYLCNQTLNAGDYTFKLDNAKFKLKCGVYLIKFLAGHEQIHFPVLISH